MSFCSLTHFFFSNCTISMAKSTRPLGPHDNISSNDNVVLRLGTWRKEIILIYYGWSTNPTPNEPPQK